MSDRMSGNEWRVVKDGGDWFAIHIESGRSAMFFTHPQALAYADEEARAVTYILPRAQHRAVISPATPTGMTLLNLPRASVIFQPGQDGKFTAVVVDQDDRVELALQLLASAETEGR